MNNELLLAIVGASLALIGRWIWDRWLAKRSRITADICELRMASVERRLEEGARTFERLTSCLTAACFIMIDLCQKSGIDCDDIRKRMIDSGINL